MSLIKWNRNREEGLPVFNNLIDRFFQSDISDFLGNRNGTSPSVNVKETKDDFKLEVAAPGMKKDDFKVTLENNFLIISAEKEDTREENDEQYSRKEFNYTSFQRSFNLPEMMVDAEKIEAKYSDGILYLTIPKKEEAKEKTPKVINIS